MGAEEILVSVAVVTALAGAACPVAAEKVACALADPEGFLLFFFFLGLGWI